MKNHYEEKFTIEEGKILYDGQSLCDEKDRFIFDNKYEINKKIGGGANGVTFLGRHKFLDVNQVIKIYFPGESKKEKEKNILEIKKNSNVELNNVNAINHDGGCIFSPEKMYFSIMRSIENHVSLKTWVENRDKYFDMAKKNYTISDRPIQYVYSASLNMAISLYKNVIIKNNQNIVHGDLHQENILVSNNFPIKEEWDDFEFEEEKIDFILHYANSNFKDAVGSLKEVPCVLIDMGTSQYSETSPSIGVDRELHFLFENTRKIMKPFFAYSKVSFREICPLHIEDTSKFYLDLDVVQEYLKLEDYGERVSDIFRKENKILNFVTVNYSRLILFYNHMFGSITNETTYLSDFNSLNLYIEGDFLNDYRVCYDRELLSILDIVSTSDESIYSFPFIQWDKVWKYFESYFPDKVFKEYETKRGKMIKKLNK